MLRSVHRDRRVQRGLRSCLAAGAMLAVCAAPVASSAQQRAAGVMTVAGAAAAGSAARSSAPYPKGPGSLSGVWFMQGYIGSTNPPRARVARTIEGEIPPMKPWAKELLEKRIKEAEEGKIFANTATYCLPQGVPYMLFGAVSGPIQVLETPGQVTIISEEFNEVWMMYLNRQFRSVDDQDGPTFHGETIARWDGDTLVANTINLNTRTTLDQVGMPHSEEMKVTTRAKRLDADTLEFVFTIDDPKTFERPWSRRVLYKKAGPDERVEDYACDNQRNSVTADGYQAQHIGE
jgi:hypothetical protein